MTTLNMIQKEEFAQKRKLNHHWTQTHQNYQKMVVALEMIAVLASVNMNHPIVDQFVFAIMMPKMKEGIDMA